MKEYELLEKQCAMMRMAESHGIDDWRKLVRCQDVGGQFVEASYPLHELWTVRKWAIGVVEGKPVFDGDILYMPNRVLVKAGEYPISLITADGSWNPPKPKTVMVEHTVEDVEILASLNRPWGNSLHRVMEDFRKALEQLK